MNETAHSTQSPLPTTRNGTVFVLALFGLIGIMVMFTEAMIMPALPTLQTEFNTTAAWASWIVSIYLLVSSVAIPIFGKLGDSYGKKKLLLVCMTFYTIGVTANGFAWNLASLIGFRALQGIGLAMFPLAFAIIRDEFPPERVPVATGIVSAMFGAGAAIGLVVGAWIANNFGWRTTYHTVIPIAIALTLLAAYKLKESPIRTPSRPDVLGAATFSIALISFLIAMTEGGTWEWASSSILGLFGLALASIVLFLFIESRVADPMISLAMLSKRNVFFTNITAFIAGLANFLVFQSVIYLLQAPAPIGCSCSLFQAGLVMAPGSLLMLVTAPLAGAIVTRRGAKLPLFMGAVALAASFCYFYAFHATQLQMLLGVMISFVGMGFMMVAMINIIIQSVSQVQTGIATAMNTIFRTVGGVVGPTIVGVYLTQYTTLIRKPTPHGLMMIPIPSDTAFDYIFLTALGVAIIGIFVILLIKGRSDQVHIEEGEPVERTKHEVEGKGRVEVGHRGVGVQIPKSKWPHDADAAPDTVLDLTAPALGANNSPVLPERELGSWPPTPTFSTTESRGYRIEFMVRDGGSFETHDANDITILSTSGHVTQLKAERSGVGDNSGSGNGESDGKMQEVTFTASDGSGGEMQGAVAVWSASAEGNHFNFMRFTPDRLRDYNAELVVKSGLSTRNVDAATVTAVNADIIRLKTERSGEDGAQVEEISFTANNREGGEMQGTVAMRQSSSAMTKQHVVNVSVMYKSLNKSTNYSR